MEGTEPMAQQPPQPPEGWQPPPQPAWQQQQPAWQQSQPPQWGPPAGQQPPPQPRRKLSGCLTAVTIFVGILVTASIIGALTGTDETAQQSTPAATEPQPTAGNAPTTAGGDDLREPVRDGKFEFVVSSFKCASGKCQAAIRVENIGDEAQHMFADNQYLFDTRGRRFSAETTLDDLWIKELNPGLSVRGTVVWNVPAEFKPDHLELHDSAFSGGVEVRL